MILATAPDGNAMGGPIDGLAVGGRLVIVGASADPVCGELLILSEGGTVAETCELVGVG